MTDEELRTVQVRKYLDYLTLDRLNQIAVQRGYNRSFWMDRLPVEKNALFPVIMSLPHNDGAEIRCQLVLNNQGTTGWLDVSPDDFEGLPTSNFLNTSGV